MEFRLGEPRPGFHCHIYIIWPEKAPLKLEVQRNKLVK